MLKGERAALYMYRISLTSCRRRIERGHEKGATFSVYHKGVLVVDLAGGYADDDIQWAMGTDIIFGLSSTVKATQALCVALQVDR